MAYLYAGLGVVMLTGIMAIFEIGLSLTGQSMLPTPPDEYAKDISMKESDIKLLRGLSSVTPDLVLKKGLCTVLEGIDQESWSLISKGRWNNSCKRRNGSYSVIVKENPSNNNRQMPYLLFSCALNGRSQCSFQRE